MRDNINERRRAIGRVAAAVAAVAVLPPLIELLAGPEAEEVGLSAARNRLMTSTRPIREMREDPVRDRARSMSNLSDPVAIEQLANDQCYQISK